MTVCLLLAAGSSSRMGKPKMLLSFKGKTLLQHAIDEVNEIKQRLVVVTGCHHNLIKDVLLFQCIHFIENKNWEEGMGSSVRTGVDYILQKHPSAESIIILVCDLPYLSSDILQALIDVQQQTGKGIVASAYNNNIGTPVLFTKKYFTQLALLNGQAGAKKVIQQFIDDTTTVDFPQGDIDIDTPEDYEQLLK